MDLKSVADAEVRGKRVLVYADLDVPLEGGIVADDTRLRGLLPTLQLLNDKGAQKITIMGHVGRPGKQSGSRRGLLWSRILLHTNWIKI
jgi:phosphoglycerate kinase